MKLHSRIIILSFCFLLVCSIAYTAEKQISLPVWPKDFSLKSGEHATFGIPNPGTGVIKVNFTWTGDPLTIGATGGDRKAVVPAASKSAPSYDFTITADGVDQAKCPVFLVRLVLPKELGANAKASGKITVDGPAIDAARFQTLIAPMMQQNQTKIQTANQQAKLFTDQAAARLASENKLRLEQKSAQTRSLQAQATKETQQMNSMLSAMAAPGKRAKRINAWSVTGILNGLKDKIRPVSTLTLAPAITSITPANGISGEQVTIAGTGLNTQSTEVYFTIASGVDVQANIISFETAQDGSVTMKVQVPEKDGVTSPFNGKVYAKAVDKNPVVTTSNLAFVYQPITAPTITYIDPVEVGPQATVNIDGNGFTNTDIIHFVIPGLSDFTTNTTFVNSTRLTAQVPSYASRQIGNGWVYVAKKTPSSWVNSQSAAMIFKPTIPLITDMPGTEAADTSILIRGMSFGQTGEVHSIDAVGVDTLLPLESWSDTHIVARTPNITGFTGSKPYKLYVKNSAGKSDQRDLSVTPTIDHILMNLEELRSTKDYFCGGGYCSADLNSAFTTGLISHHQAGMFDGHKGDDTYFMTRTLKNGWVVEEIVFKNMSSRANFPFGGAEGRLEGWNKDSASPYVKIHWWCDASWGDAYYSLSIKIKGPKGTAY